MSRKHLVTKFDMLKGVSAVSAQTSVITNVEQLDSASIHVKFSAANSGSFILEARNGVYKENEVEENWYALDFGVPLNIIAETEVQIMLKEMPFSEIRLKWVPTTGTGVINSYLTMKSYGA